MRRKPAIAISHLEPSMDQRYVLSALARIWISEGFRVEIGRSYGAEAGVCILHHDRTKLERATLPQPPSGMRPVNGRVLDISKRTYSSLMLGPHDIWPGPVIIKTNLNHFGVPESEASRENPFRKLRRRLARLSWRGARMLPDRFYPVLRSLADVPNWVWSDSALIVEKFMPERTGDALYSVRGWIFLGDKGYGYRLFSTHPLVKTGTMVRYEYHDTVPDELMALRQKMNFDFGKFDYVVHGGKAILLDANKTPSYAGADDSPRLRRLAEGIEAFL